MYQLNISEYSNPEGLYDRADQNHRSIAQGSAPHYSQNFNQVPHSIPIMPQHQYDSHQFSGNNNSLQEHSGLVPHDHQQHLLHDLRQQHPQQGNAQHHQHHYPNQEQYQEQQQLQLHQNLHLLQLQIQQELMQHLHQHQIQQHHEITQSIQDEQHQQHLQNSQNPLPYQHIQSSQYSQSPQQLEHNIQPNAQMSNHLKHCFEGAIEDEGFSKKSAYSRPQLNSFTGPISAPATTEIGDDYFLFVGLNPRIVEREESQKYYSNLSSTFPEKLTFSTFLHIPVDSGSQEIHQSAGEYLNSNSTFFDSGLNGGNSQSTQSTKNSLSRSHSTHNPSRMTRRRTFSAQKPLGKSNLSLSYTGYATEVAIVSPETSNNNSDDSKHTTFKDLDILPNLNKGSESTVKKNIRKKKSKPGLRIKLDDLEPKAKKIMSPSNHPGMSISKPSFPSPGMAAAANNVYMSPGSSRGLVNTQKTSVARTGYESPNLELGDLRLGRAQNSGIDGSTDLNDFYNEDLYLTMNLESNLDYTQENVTPFMFPPQSENCDYFGEFNDVSQLALAPILQSTESQISTAQGYVSVHDISLQQSKRNYDQSSAQADFYANDDYENQKIEAQFTPISFGNAFPQEKAQNEVWRPNQKEPNNGNVYTVDLQQYIPSRYDDSQSHMHFARPSLQNQYSDHHNYDYDKPNVPSPSHDVASSRDRIMNMPGANNPTYSNFEGKDNKQQNLETVSQGEHVVPVLIHSTLGQASQTRSRQPLKDEDAPEPNPDKPEGTKRKQMKGSVCAVCDKFITRDFSRHMRIHDDTGRFQCVFPSGYCHHKSRKFNRPYDYKKHLLNMHFMFDDVTAKLAPNLTEKLDATGKCTACGQSFKAADWLESHILSSDSSKKCYKLVELEQILMEYMGYRP